MKDLFLVIFQHKAEIMSELSSLYLIWHRLYTYVADKGGYRTMWYKFQGPKQPQVAEVKQQDNNEKTSVDGKPIGS